ncbi:type IX secretion/gliding motility protein PorT/SprT [Winogradskyella immobilis]|uniref:PorT family protein n=1 Tax=Winogradskyella immobilis TaxID=2816852 RepID=A0ABS8EJ47_9FLAO|nr:porin family protein [Winogradskyella immobilis]MCC1483226.1 PorT family protein [Winogradskyella immobilis]MCG0015320.1 PorT family protein [Winogradskyella immobilis]
MKKLISVVIILLISSNSFAQLFTKEKIPNLENMDKKILSWGYFLGFNSYDFQFNYEQDLDDILVDTTVGFQVGLTGDLRLNDHLNLRLEPGVFFTTRNLQYNESAFGGIDFRASDLIREVKSTYIHVPLLLKFSANRINNFRPFIVGGLSTAINLSSNENNPDDNSSGEFRTTNSNYFYEIGFGIDLYLTYFKFTPSIRGVFGLNDELVRDEDPNSPWTGNVRSMKTRGIFINFTFR